MLSIILSHHTPIHLIDNRNQSGDSSRIREQSKGALMVLLIERCFGEHSLIISRDKGISVITRQAINESDSRDWIYAHSSYSYKLTKEGISVLDSGSVENYLNSLKIEKEKISQPIINVHAENVVYGDNNGNITQTSDRLHSTKSRIVKNNSSSKEKGGQKSFMTTFSIIVGALAGLIAIYKFIIEDLIK